MRLEGVAVELSVMRRNPDSGINFVWLHRWAKSFTLGHHQTQYRDTYRRAAFLYGLAADAVSRLRAALAEADRA